VTWAPRRGFARFAVALDLGQPDSLQRALEHARRDLGAIGNLVNA
jgi:NAD(P)-dependent dehydrogenase (short-subunit alcohol dehydrogenase family)